ncbi:DUF389 domain-containing protein [Cyanobium sp. NIES-981]|uniref:DUF389 domain-containing protein n=1 Tax=Cyanobium sp. NIES-981 TaxID=1851505 RepID=UPI0007DCD339|nr:DUF389 domain-containing protein [Cyanobium sp. NIES-981]SBO42758.1 conserved membrane protein of unknown function [Cyanobium sp. NIES-981]
MAMPVLPAKVLSQRFQEDATLDQEFVVLSTASSLIATMGLLANSTAVVIGAMLIAPWILPLRATAFAILRGHLRLVGRALLTLAIGVFTTVAISTTLGWMVGLPLFGSEVIGRTTPNLLDLGIAIVAGAIATYAKVRTKAIGSVAGTAIAVALVPPVCVLGLLIAAGEWQRAQGAGLLFAANLLGILSGALVTLGITRPELRQKLLSSKLGFVSLLLTGLLLVPLTTSFLTLTAEARRQLALTRVENDIAESLRNETITLGKDAELVDVSIDWAQNPPLIRASVRVSKPNLPTPRQVAAVQDFINSRQPYRYRLLVQRTSIDVIGPETTPNPENLVISPEILGAPVSTPFVPSVPPLPGGGEPADTGSDGQPRLDPPPLQPARPGSGTAPSRAPSTAPSGDEGPRR